MKDVFSTTLNLLATFCNKMQSSTQINFGGNMCFQSHGEYRSKVVFFTEKTFLNKIWGQSSHFVTEKVFLNKNWGLPQNWFSRPETKPSGTTGTVSGVFWYKIFYDWQRGFDIHRRNPRFSFSTSLHFGSVSLHFWSSFTAFTHSLSRSNIVFILPFCNTSIVSPTLDSIFSKI